MNNCYLSIFVVLFLFGFTPIKANNPESTTQLSGLVVNQDLEPISGAYIILVETFHKTLSNTNGTFSISQLKPGSYLLTVQSVGHEFVSQQVTIRNEETNTIKIVCMEKINQSPPVNIVGNYQDRLFTKISGSLTTLNKAEIDFVAPISGNDVFRRIPGINVVDEEGAGLRINIGIRGLDPDRSRRVLMLEDGIPIALAPYGEPEMYYTPAIEKMEAVEVMKGAGQILYGPQTVGGVVNFITKSVPDSLQTTAKFQYGSGDYHNIFVSHGNRLKDVGYLINIHKKGAQNLGMIDFDLLGVDAKMEIYLNKANQLNVKMGFYQENSNATYVGITQPMFNEGTNDFARLAPNDNLQVQRANFSLVHQYKISKNTKIKNLIFGQQVTRNWRRQDFAYNGIDNTKPGNWSGQTWGNEEVLEGAMYMRNGTGQRNRNFDVFGAETRITHDYRFFGLKHQLSGGMRYLYERAFENRINGTKPDATSGALVAYEERPGNAFSTFLQQQSSIENKVHFHYGLRLESFNQTREIFRGNYHGKITDTAIVNSNLVQQLVPGGGLTYVFSEKLIIFSSAHRGFAPPRTKDAIDNTGGSYDLEAELSNNVELGIRGKILKGVQFEMTGFRLDFINQIIPISESSGGGGTGLINAGASIHQGIEGSITLQSSDFFNWKKWFVMTNTNVTFVDAKFIGDPLINNTAIKNLRTPYAPQWITNSIIQFQHIDGIGIRISHQYVASQFTDIPNTIEPSNNGRTGIMPAYEIWDLNTFYDWKSKNWRFNFTVKNLTNERYIATRRPQGIRVGLPRTFIIGLEKTF